MVTARRWWPDRPTVSGVADARSVVFAADDFGMSDAVNAAVEAAYRQGVLGRASLMVTGAAAADAVARARRMPGLSVGLHLVLVEGQAACPPASIPGLVDASGRFGSDQVARGVRYFFDPRSRPQLAAEIAAQFSAFAATGLALSHADAHKHMQLHPTVARLMIEIGRDFGLPALRVPSEPAGPLRACGTDPGVASRALALWSGVLRRQVRRGGLTAEDHCFGLAWSGQMSLARVRCLVTHLPPGRSEIYFHPAVQRDAVLCAAMPGYDHCGELQALLDPALPQLLAAAGVVIARR